jgi:hypothetical protein
MLELSETDHLIGSHFFVCTTRTRALVFRRWCQKFEVFSRSCYCQNRILQFICPTRTKELQKYGCV